MLPKNEAGAQAPAAPAYHVRYMDGAPGPFSPSGPESARSYLRRFRMYCEIQGIINNVQECARRLGVFLRDSAQVWLDNKQFANFADLEAQFFTRLRGFAFQAGPFGGAGQKETG